MEKPSNCYEWRAGEIVVYDLPEDLAPREGEDWGVEWFRRIGYEIDEIYGSDDLEQITVYERICGEGHPFAVDIMGVNRCRALFLPSFDARVRLLQMVLAPFYNVRLEDRMDQLIVMTKRAFQAWHGHDGLSYCGSCDPEAHDQRVAAAKRRAEAKAAAKGG